MKIKVVGVPRGISLHKDELTIDLKNPDALSWLDMLSHYRQQMANVVEANLPEPVVPHVPDPSIGQLLKGIFKK